MITNESKVLAQWAMEFLLKNGCQAGRISLYNGSNTSFEIRDMKVDKLQQAAENGLSIQLFVDGRYGAFSTNRLDKTELERFIRGAIEATRYLAEDRARTLPDPSLYYKGGKPDLQLHDPTFNTLPPDQKMQLALQVCDEMMGKDQRIISCSSSFGDEETFRYMIASNGFEGETSSTSFSLVGSVSVRAQGDARPESYWYDTSLFFDGLIKEGIGNKALERALAKLGQKKVASGKYRMVVDRMNTARLLSPIAGALYGSSIQQNNSFLLNQLNQKVLGSNFTLTDEPHLIKSAGARYFDGEGVATRPMPIFENGVLKTYFIDTYSANKLDTEPTISGPSIITMSASGNNDTDGLVAITDKGILVTGFNGGNCNSTTGNFSYGVEGFLIENGKLTQPVSEMNITGDMITLCNNLIEVGNDPLLSSSWRIPSLLFDEVEFSGL